jgi:hypothetical protein
MKDYKVEIVTNNNEKDNNEGLHILARIIARRFLAEYNRTLTDEVLEDASHEQQI